MQERVTLLVHSVEDSFEKSFSNARRPSVVRYNGRHPLVVLVALVVVQVIAEGSGGLGVSG